MTVAYRADHVGSFLRPADLLAARAGVTDASRLRAMEDQYILKALAKQKELGFRIFTDGELRRRNFMSELTDAVDGFDLEDAIARDWDAAQEKPKVASVTGVVNRQAETDASADGARIAVPEAAQPGRHQDSAAERDAIPGDRVQARSDR